MISFLGHLVITQSFPEITLSSSLHFSLLSHHSQSHKNNHQQRSQRNLNTTQHKAFHFLRTKEFEEEEDAGVGLKVEAFTLFEAHRSLCTSTSDLLRVGIRGNKGKI
ncbi:unnamed protein product [Lathyrus oleraceus]